MVVHQRRDKRKLTRILMSIKATRIAETLEGLSLSVVCNFKLCGGVLMGGPQELGRTDIISYNAVTKQKW